MTGRRLGAMMAVGGGVLALAAGSVSAIVREAPVLPHASAVVAGQDVPAIFGLNGIAQQADLAPPPARAPGPRSHANPGAAKASQAPEDAVGSLDPTRTTALSPQGGPRPAPGPTEATKSWGPEPSGRPLEAPGATTPPTPGRTPSLERYTGRVVVKLVAGAGGPSRIARVAEAAGTEVKVAAQLTATGGTVVTVKGDAEAAAARIAAQAGVLYAVPERRFTTSATPDDPTYPSQWDLPAINVPSAWASSVGAGVTLAVIDTGRLDHPDLQGRYLPGYDFISDATYSLDGTGRDGDATDVGDWAPARTCGDPTAQPSSWHGLHVAGTIAALTGNGIGIAGIAHGARIVPLRALGRCGGSNVDVADAMVWAAGGSVPGAPVNANPAKIINLSLGGPGACTSIEQSAIDVAGALGALVVVAAGNDGGDVADFSPANCRGVVVVGATDQYGTPAEYSNRGAAVTLSAPGTSIWGLGNQGSKGADPAGWAVYARSGTSMATPHVSAVAALMWSAAPGATAARIRQALLSSVMPFATPTSGRGVGILDAAAAVSAIRSGNTAAPQVTALSLPGVRAVDGGVVTLTGSDLAGASVTIGGHPGTVLASSPTSLTVRIPTGAVGRTQILVQTDVGRALVPFFYDSRYVVGRGGRVFVPLG